MYLINLTDIAPQVTVEREAYIKRLQWRMVSLAHNAVIHDVERDTTHRYADFNLRDESGMFVGCASDYEREPPFGLAPETDDELIPMVNVLFMIRDVVESLNLPLLVAAYCALRQRGASFTLAQRLGQLYNFTPNVASVPTPAELTRSIEMHLRSSSQFSISELNTFHYDYIADDYLAFCQKQLMTLSLQALRDDSVITAQHFARRITALREHLATL